MRNYGVIGFPLSHSFSPEYFKQKFLKENIEATYVAFPIEDLNQIRLLVKEKNLGGFNVTIPYKEKIVSLLDSLSDEAKEIGAVNCVKVESDPQDSEKNKLIGFNTDAYGISFYSLH